MKVLGSVLITFLKAMCHVVSYYEQAPHKMKALLFNCETKATVCDMPGASIDLTHSAVAVPLLHSRSGLRFLSLSLASAG